LLSKTIDKMSQIPTFEMVRGKPDSAIVELKKFSTLEIQEELFEHEIEALNVIKQNKIAKFFNDRFLMGCLFSRKMDIVRTMKMLKANLKWRMAHNYEKNPEMGRN